MMRTKAHSGVYTVVDVETNGHEVIEIALLRMVWTTAGLVPVSGFSSLVKPSGHAWSPRAAQVNGIVPAMVRSAPTFDQLVDRVLTELDDATLVAHGASYERRFLGDALSRAGRSWCGPVLCTLKLARRRYPSADSHSLGHLAQKLGIPRVRPHRSCGDVAATALLLANLLTASASPW